MKVQYKHGGERQFTKMVVERRDTHRLGLKAVWRTDYGQAERFVGWLWRRAAGDWRPLLVQHAPGLPHQQTIPADFFGSFTESCALKCDAVVRLAELSHARSEVIE